MRLSWPSALRLYALRGCLQIKVQTPYSYLSGSADSTDFEGGLRGWRVQQDEPDVHAPRDLLDIVRLLVNRAL